MKRKHSSENMDNYVNVANEIVPLPVFLHTEKARRKNFISDDPEICLTLGKLEEVYQMGYILEEEYLDRKLDLQKQLLNFQDAGQKKDFEAYKEMYLPKSSAMDMEIEDYFSEEERESSPVHSLAEVISLNFSSLRPELIKTVQESGFENQTPFQSHFLPALLKGQSMFLQAQSGCGKTTLSIWNILQKVPEHNPGVFALVLCSSAELVFQTYRQFQRFGKHLPFVNIQSFHGGVPISQDAERLKSSPHVVIGTPGRIFHLMRSNQLNLNSLQIFVVDECDQQILNAETKKEIDAIFHKTENRLSQILMTCTCVLKETESAIFKQYFKNKFSFQHDPFVPIFFTEPNLLKLIPNRIWQYTISVGSESEKLKKLEDLIDMIDFSQVIIFVSTTEKAELLYRALINLNFPCVRLHSSKNVQERLETFKQFQDFTARILITTNVMCRGVHFDRLNFVINYDAPESTSIYLNRLGRLGGYEPKGLLVTFIAPKTESDHPKRQSDEELVQTLLGNGFSIAPFPNTNISCF